MKTHRCLLLFAATLVCPLSGAQAPVAEPVAPVVDPVALATTPDVQTAEWAQSWWGPRHEEKLAERDAWVADGKSPALVFIGDSITHGWENQHGKALWNVRFATRGALNLGFSGDRTEHVLWRLGVGEAGEENNEVAGLTPELFVVMIGTNNTGHRQGPPEATAAGVEAILDRLHELSPESKVLLLAIFPRGAEADDPLRLLNDRINQRLETFGQREGVEYLDIADAFLEEDGTLPKAVMPDLLHPHELGYQLWADAIEPHLARLLGE